MKYLVYISCILLCLYLTSCSFQTSFFKQLNKNFINNNLIISPLSAYQILGLSANGANGETLKQMILALGNENLDELNQINTKILNVAKKFSTVEIGNAIMTKFEPKPNFLSIAKKYDAPVESLKNVAQINSWCSRKTHGKINKILDSIDPLTRIILLNAIYFKGEWFKEFKKESTSKKPFYNLNDKTKEKKVDRMSITENFRYYQDKELQIVELPYRKDSMSAVIILPNEKININNFISGLDDNKIQHLLKKMFGEKVHLELPKFELQFSSSLIDVLKELGMVLPFTEFKADFSGMKKEKDIYIDKVIQKTYLKVDEKGTEAAAVTVVKHGRFKSVQIKPRIYPMIIDRPFLFMLRNKEMPQNYEMLFMSKIEKL